MNSRNIPKEERKALRDLSKLDEEGKWPLVSGHWVLTLLDYIEYIEGRYANLSRGRSETEDKNEQRILPEDANSDPGVDR